MSVEIEKNIYGLSEGVFKACLYLGLKFPSVAVDNPQPVPSDYFGDDFELDSTTIKKLRLDLKWTRNKFSKQYKAFTKKFSTQKPLRQTKTDLSVYFCDFALCHKEQILASYGDYFDFEFYNKSLKLRGTFLLSNYSRRRALFNDLNYMTFVNNKVKTNQFFDEFLRRDWIYTRTCTFEEFKIFVEKHPCFFSKIFNGASGRGAQVVKIDPNEDIEKVFADFKGSDRIMEEIVTQHETLAAFCPDTVNTIRVNTILDVHNVVHILTTSGRFGRVGSVVDNFHGGGCSAIIDPKTGIITSDAINGAHERMQKHPDSGKIFKGFQYPCWDKVLIAVQTMAKRIPQLRNIGWDITINDEGEAVLIEANGNAPGVDVQQAPDDTGRLHLYQPLIEEMQAYKKEEMKLLGYRVNNIQDFDSAYELSPALWNPKRKFAIDKLIPECTSLIDVGCRKSNFVKTTTPPPRIKILSRRL